jgi:phospholipid transport system transporter-binding protein
MITQGEAGRLFVEGPIQMDSVAALLEALLPRVEAGDVLLDFSRVPHVDSSSLALLLSLLRKARSAQHSLKLCSAPPAFNSLAALYGVDSIFAEHLAHDAAA